MRALQQTVDDLQRKLEKAAAPRERQTIARMENREDRENAMRLGKAAGKRGLGSGSSANIGGTTGSNKAGSKSGGRPGRGPSGKDSAAAGRAVMANRRAVQTSLRGEHGPGSTKIEIALDGADALAKVGWKVRIGAPGDAYAEERFIVGFGSVLLHEGLKYVHGAGEPVFLIPPTPKEATQFRKLAQTHFIRQEILGPIVDAAAAKGHEIIAARRVQKQYAARPVKKSVYTALEVYSEALPRALSVVASTSTSSAGPARAPIPSVACFSYAGKVFVACGRGVVCHREGMGAAELRSLFDRMDWDGDGIVARVELAHMLRVDPVVRRLLGGVDANGLPRLASASSNSSFAERGDDEGDDEEGSGGDSRDIVRAGQGQLTLPMFMTMVRAQGHRGGKAASPRSKRSMVVDASRDADLEQTRAQPWAKHLDGNSLSSLYEVFRHHNLASTSASSAKSSSAAISGLSPLATVPAMFAALDGPLPADDGRAINLLKAVSAWAGSEELRSIGGVPCLTFVEFVHLRVTLANKYGSGGDLGSGGGALGVPGSVGDPLGMGVGLGARYKGAGRLSTAMRMLRAAFKKCRDQSAEVQGDAGDSENRDPRGRGVSWADQVRAIFLWETNEPLHRVRILMQPTTHEIFRIHTRQGETKIGSSASKESPRRTKTKLVSVRDLVTSLRSLPGGGRLLQMELPVTEDEIAAAFGITTHHASASQARAVLRTDAGAAARSAAMAAAAGLGAAGVMSIDAAWGSGAVESKTGGSSVGDGLGSAGTPVAPVPSAAAAAAAERLTLSRALECVEMYKQEKDDAEIAFLSSAGRGLNVDREAVSAVTVDVEREFGSKHLRRERARVRGGMSEAQRRRANAAESDLRRRAAAASAARGLIAWPHITVCLRAAEAPWRMFTQPPQLLRAPSASVGAEAQRQEFAGTVYETLADEASGTLFALRRDGRVEVWDARSDRLQGSFQLLRPRADDAQTYGDVSGDDDVEDGDGPKLTAFREPFSARSSSSSSSSAAEAAAGGASGPAAAKAGKRERARAVGFRTEFTQDWQGGSRRHNSPSLTHLDYETQHVTTRP